MFVFVRLLLCVAAERHFVFFVVVLKGGDSREFLFALCCVVFVYVSNRAARHRGPQGTMVSVCVCVCLFVLCVCVVVAVCCC